MQKLSSTSKCTVASCTQYPARESALVFGHAQKDPSIRRRVSCSFCVFRERLWARFTDIWRVIWRVHNVVSERERSRTDKQPLAFTSWLISTRSTCTVCCQSKIPCPCANCVSTGAGCPDRPARTGNHSTTHLVNANRPLNLLHILRNQLGTTRARTKLVISV